MFIIYFFFKSDTVYICSDKTIINESERKYSSSSASYGVSKQGTNTTTSIALGEKLIPKYFKLADGLNVHVLRLVAVYTQDMCDQPFPVLHSHGPYLGITSGLVYSTVNTSTHYTSWRMPSHLCRTTKRNLGMFMISLQSERSIRNCKPLDILCTSY